MLRFLLVAGGLLAIVGLFYDPYTLYVDTQSPFALAAPWRLGLTLVEVLILLIFCVNAFIRRYRRAGILMAVAVLLNVLSNTIIVALDGIDRFLVMFGTAETLSTYLALLAVRISMLAIILLKLDDRRSRDSSVSS